MKYNWLNLLPFGKEVSTINARPVKKIVVVVFFVPMACRVFGMISVGDRAKILRTERNIATKARHLLRFL
jgi:hypothetical protein